MIAVDTNILVYAHRREMPLHEPAKRILAGLAGGPVPWAIPWPVVHEFFAVVTARAWGEARTPPAIALDTLAAWLEHPGCQAINEQPEHLSVLDGLVRRANLAGGAVHDARIAAICLTHRIEELWTVDRDFARFPDLRTRNPLIPSLNEPVVAYAAPPPQRRRAHR